MFIGYSVFRKAQGLGKLNFFPASVKNFHFAGLTPVFTLGLGCQNTSNQSFTVHSIAGDVISNGYYVGTISAFYNQSILPNSQTILNVEVKLFLLGIANDLIQAFQTGNFQQEMKIDATANVDNLQIPLDLKYKVG